MTLNELIEGLENLRRNGYGDVEVVANTQPNYPLQSDSITITGYNGHPKYRDGEEDEDAEKGDPLVYIAVGECYSYGQDYAWSGEVDLLDDEDFTGGEE